jgi:N-acetylglutamate synthase-like GNAT family acetyltransferase
MNPIFRDTKEIDWEQLLGLQHSASWSRHRSLEQLKRATNNSQLLITAWEKDKLIACARVLTDYVYRAIVFDVIVHSDYQGKGLGRQLMDQVVCHDSLKEVEYFFLYTADKEEFYRRLGWEEYTGTSFRLVNRSSPNLALKE